MTPNLGEVVVVVLRNSVEEEAVVGDLTSMEVSLSHNKRSSCARTDSCRFVDNVRLSSDSTGSEAVSCLMNYLDS